MTAAVYGWTDKCLAMKYIELEQPDDKIQAMYVWIDGSGETLRAKTRTLDYDVKVAEDCPEWNFDGSSTGQAAGANSDVFLMPVTVFKDPFRGGKNKLVLCETFDHNRMPHITNKRRTCTEVMRRAGHVYQPEFSMDQEFTLVGMDQHPFGWPKNGFPGPEGPYFCATGADKVYGRDIIEAHLRLCLAAGVKIAATNSEVMPSQWSFTIGTCNGIELADHLWMARFILHRVAEDFGVIATLNPKPVLGEWHAAGCPITFSTKQMREDGGLEHIEEAMDKLCLKHARHIALYDPKGGEDNKRRMSTRSLTLGRFGSGGNKTGVIIPEHVEEAGKGFIADRRPSSNSDPYVVTEILVRTIVFDE